MKVRMCDRCGLECGDDHRAEIDICFMSVSRRDTESWLQSRKKEMDLCNLCIEAFDKFMNEKT